jgi:hypothetical protein
MSYGYNPISRMIKIAAEDGVDVLRIGIPTDIFIAEWENHYGITMPEGFIEELEREYKRGVPVNVAIEYWASLNSWFVDNNE